MKRRLLAFFLVLLFFGALIVFIPSSLACHNKTVTVTPGTEQDITDINTYMVKYEIDVKLTPGCSSQYWVGFTVDAAPNGWSRILYEKDDPTKTSIIGTGTPPDADHDNWNHWIDVGSGSEVHFYAILEVKVTNQNLANGNQATITVHCWSCDGVPNDLEDDPVTTITTLNIPHGIRIYHTVAYMATQWVYPGTWAEFDLTIRDIGNASGLVDLYKDDLSSPCLEGGDWLWEFSQNPLTLPNKGTVSFKLKVKPPADAEYGDYAVFIVKGVSRADPDKFKHSVAAKTIVTIPLPDLSIKSCDMKCMVDEPSDGEKVNISIDVYNLGDIAVSDFELCFKLTDPGAEQDIGTVLITDTLNPNNKMNVKCEWIAIEGDHSLCIHADEKGLIIEKDEEGNNEAGIIVTVGPAKPKSIILKTELDPLTCMPGGEFTVSGSAKYNKEYDYAPVTNTNVKIRIVETDKIYNTKTNNKGEFSQVCKAPDVVKTYTIQISISKEGISQQKTEYLTVSSFVVDVSVDPRTVVSGKEVTVFGDVTENGDGEATVDIKIELLDKNNNIVYTTTSITDTDGIYSVKFNTPIITKYTEYTIKVTGTKGEISGSKETPLYVDIDTDKDNIPNTLDDDDDGDKYPDIIELESWTDPLDDTDSPTPVADAGLDQTINEGDKVTLSGVNSYSPAGLELTFKWDLGDDSAIKTGPTQEYTYSSDGVYTVRLIVEDTYGGIDTASIKITVDDLDPTVEIEGVTTGEKETLLEFSAIVTTIIDTIDEYNWDFDDGTTGTGKEIQHKWTTPGTYTIKLTVTDSDGSKAEDTFTVIITGEDDGPGDTTGDDSKSQSLDYAGISIGLVVIIIVVILLALFLLMRKKKPTTAPGDGRVAGNVNAQDSRRPITPFADAEIKPAMGAGAVTQKMAVPGTVPYRPAVASQPQRHQLPPAPQQTQAQPQPYPQQPQQSPQVQPREQRDWDWNFNE